MDMKKLKIVLFCLIAHFPILAFSQLINNGGHLSITNGAVMVLDSLNFINQTSSYDGDITSAGKIYVKGNWLNSATGGQLFDSTSSAGEVIFWGYSAHTISGNPTHFYNLTVDSNASVEVVPQTLVKVYNNLTINGTFTLKTDTSRTAMLIDAGNNEKLIGSGTFRFERYIPKGGWHYVSTPCVYTSNSTNFFWGAALYDYNETTGLWNKKSNNQQLDVMRGYDAFFKNGNKTVVFEGKFNTGDVTVSLTKNRDGYNFVGNPYPVTINWDESNGWVKTNVDNAIYIWDAALNNGQGDYMEYVNGVGNRGGTQYIPATQAFWVKCNSSYGGSLTIKNQAKCFNTAAYFREGNPEYEILRIKAIQPPFDNETTICINPEASPVFEGQFDALKIFHSNISIPQIFTLSEDNKELAINSQNISDKASGIPLGLKAGHDGKCTLSFDLSGISGQMNVYLEDKTTGSFIDLKSSPVNVFDVMMSDDPMRFVIHFGKIQSLTGIDDYTRNNEANSFYCYALNGRIYVYSSQEYNNAILKIFDVTGREIYASILNGKGITPVIHDFKPGIYLISLVCNGNILTNKVIVHN